MKLAIIGSRSLTNIVLDSYISKEVREIVSGGAVGVDFCAAEYAKLKRLKLTEFLPQYERYGRAAPIKRNERMVEMADAVLVIWDGTSKGTEHTIAYAEKQGKMPFIIRASA